MNRSVFIFVVMERSQRLKLVTMGLMTIKVAQGTVKEFERDMIVKEATSIQQQFVRKFVVMVWMLVTRSAMMEILWVGTDVKEIVKPQNPIGVVRSKEIRQEFLRFWKANLMTHFVSKSQLEWNLLVKLQEQPQMQWQDFSWSKQSWVLEWALMFG